MPTEQDALTDADYEQSARDFFANQKAMMETLTGKPQPPFRTSDPIVNRFNLIAQRHGMAVENIGGVTGADFKGNAIPKTPVPYWLPADWETDYYPAVDTEEAFYQWFNFMHDKTVHHLHQMITHPELAGKYASRGDERLTTTDVVRDADRLIDHLCAKPENKWQGAPAPFDGVLYWTIADRERLRQELTKRRHWLLASWLKATRTDGKPVWYRRERQLKFQGTLVKKFIKHAESQFPVLDEFQKQGWPTEITNPLEGSDNVPATDQAGNCVKGLNREMANPLIKFFWCKPEKTIGWRLNPQG